MQADFSMDGWIGNLLEVWEKVTGNGKMVSLGANFPDAPVTETSSIANRCSPVSKLCSASGFLAPSRRTRR